MEIHQTSGRWRLGLVLSLLTTFLWGILPIVLEIVLKQMDVFTITWYRFLGAGLFLGLFLTVRKGLPCLQGQPPVVFALLLIVTLGLGCNYVLYLLGLSRVAAGAAQVLIQLAPAMVMLGALIFFKERFGKGQWFGFFMLSAGMLIFFHNKLGEIFMRFGDFSLGVMLVVFSAIAWAVYALAQKQLLIVMSSAAILLFVYIDNMLVLFPFAHPQLILKLDIFHLSLLAFCAINTIIAYGTFSEALVHWEASRVSAVLALTPIITLIVLRFGSYFCPHLVNYEKLTFFAVVGAVLVVIGSMTIALAAQQGD